MVEEILFGLQEPMSHIDLWQTLHLGIVKTGFSSCVNKRTAEAGHVGWQPEG